MRLSTFNLQLSTFAAVAAMAIAASAADGPAKSREDLMRELQNISRDKNASLEAITNAYQAVTACTNLLEHQRGEAAKSFANAHTSKGKRAEALAFAETSAAATNIPVRFRAELFTIAARSFADNNRGDSMGGYRNDGFLKAESVYAKTFDIPDATPEIKIEAYKNMANMRLEADRDLNGALALLDKAIALPGLDAEKKAAAEHNKADVLRRAGEYDKALAIFNAIAANEALGDNRRRTALGKTFEIAMDRDGAEAAVKVRRDSQAKFKNKDGNPLCPDHDIANFCNSRDVDPQFAFRHYAKVVSEWNSGRIDSRNIFKAYSNAGFDTFAKEMPAVIAKVSGKADIVSDFFSAMAAGRDAGAASKDERYPETVLALIDSVVATNRPSVVRLFEYASRHPQVAKRAIAYAREIGKLPADDKSVKPDIRKNAAIVVALADANGNSGRAVQLLNDWLKKNPPADNLERADFLLRAVKRAAILRQEDVARAIHAERAKLVRKEEPRSLPCPYIENAPQDISEILRSDFYKKAPKGLADRKFGDDLKFIIETDVTAQRTMTEFNGKPFRPTEIFAFCDAHGVKVMLRQFCDKEALAKFKSGFGGIGGYEAYIATGFDTPYTFLGFGPGATKLSSDFLTQYDNGTGYRNPKSADDSILLSNYVADDSVISLLAFSWVKAFADLPSNGDKWYFEPLCWSNGGWSWGGSKSVHNRSAFGALVFEGITPKAAAAIRRGVVKKAADTYWNAKSARSNGQVEIWKDPELGDPEFYKECVEPVVKRLDTYTGKVKADMSDEDVMEVYENAAREWMNIDFVVSSLRSRYIKQKMLED